MGLFSNMLGNTPLKEEIKINKENVIGDIKNCLPDEWLMFNPPFSTYLYDLVIAKKKTVQENIEVRGNPFNPHEKIIEKTYSRLLGIKISNEEEATDDAYDDLVHAILVVDSVEKLLRKIEARSLSLEGD